jgi:glycosyltransferase involved in cell wall biosynthesis
LKNYPIGSERNGLEVLPRSERKTILLLSDDLRRHSGISTMSREFVLGLCHRYNFVQLGALINHPDEGLRVFDLAESIQQETGVPDVYAKIYPSSGYGTPEIVRTLMNLEKIDGILHFTDPRYWIWLYQMEHEVRQFIPIMYYTIWDNLPDPAYNKDYYKSCDLLMSISKQTYGITKRLMKEEMHDWQFKYVPHGINQEVFKPVNKDDPKYWEFAQKAFPNGKPEFVVGFNSRNIKRKCPSDLIHAFHLFRQSLSVDLQNNVVLLMHTRKVDQAGTDLGAVIEAIQPDLPVIFSEGEIPPNEMKYFYALCDVFVNISSNEGFGLSSAEAVTCGIPLIVNVTGGLQDQCGFKISNKYLTEEAYVSLESLHRTELKFDGHLNFESGEWVKPSWPATSSLMGSVVTPYIFDDLPNVPDVAEKLKEWYHMPSELRNQKGLLGREAFKDLGLTSENMCESMGKAMDGAFKNFTPRERFKLVQV